MFMDRKTQYCQDVSSSQLCLEIQCSPNQNPASYFIQTDSKVYVESQKAQNSQDNIKEQSWRQTPPDIKNYYKAKVIKTGVTGFKKKKKGNYINQTE